IASSSCAEYSETLFARSETCCAVTPAAPPVDLIAASLCAATAADSWNAFVAAPPRPTIGSVRPAVSPTPARWNDFPIFVAAAPVLFSTSLATFEPNVFEISGRISTNASPTLPAIRDASLHPEETEELLRCRLAAAARRVLGARPRDLERLPGSTLPGR